MPGLLRGVARVAVASGTATAVSNRVSRRQANKWAQQGEQEYTPPGRLAPPMGPQQPQQAPPPPPVAAPVATESVVDQLKGLAELKQQGILTEEEFAQQKARILAG
jgi:hypothetical protein